jgi:ribosomal protein S18 acetylase RimI-like enzyme
VSDAERPTFVIRPYAPADRPALEAMYADFEPKRAAQGLPPQNADGQRRWLDRTLARGYHQVAECAGRVVGHVMLIPMDANGDRARGGAEASVELANFVHQSVRNRGLGTALNRAAVDAACKAGYRRVWLSVEPSNRAAIRSYERAGFRRLPGSLWAPEIEMAVACGPGCIVDC